MKIIHSKDNALFKTFVRIAAGKDKDHALLEGIHLCQEWASSEAGNQSFAIFDQARLEQTPELQAIFQSTPETKRVLLSSALMQTLERVEHGQGVCFIVNPPRPGTPERIECSALWLDRIQDPGNLGTLLRTAVAAGIKQVYCSQGCAISWSPKVLRSAQGAHFSLQIFEQCNLLELSKRLVVPLAAMSLNGSNSLYETRLPARLVWLAGNEGQGIDQALEALANLKVFIPQAAGVESLNVAAATAVCLFEHRRQILSAASTI